MSSYNSKISSYRGRFAPTPTGPLHMGSLVAALASYLDAKANNGKWLVRIDDIDPPREMKGATASILKCLEDFGLFWDESVVYQSNQSAQYQNYLEDLSGNSYRCTCSRKQIGSSGYNGVCFGKKIDSTEPSSIRFRIDDSRVEFEDKIQLSQSVTQCEDFVIKRKDGLWAYHLAVVVDDYLSGITDVVRGVDLLESTYRHIQLQDALGFRQPNYAHIPVLVEANGQKLSKQNLAKPIGGNEYELVDQLRFALGKLNIEVTEANSISEMLELAIIKWDMGSLVGQTQLGMSKP